MDVLSFADTYGFSIVVSLALETDWYIYDTRKKKSRGMNGETPDPKSFTQDP